MRVFALVGRSGTGKSTSALSFAHSKNIPAMIDDGLLIYKGRKAAGSSAKYEKNYITAIKRAVFFYEDHRKEVQNAIKALDIHSLLIIGTSTKMVDQIAETLQLGKITKYYKIEEIRSSKEINMALYVRKTEGKHIIPIPYVQVEQNILKKIIMKGKKIFSTQKEEIGETTIIRPRFHQGTIHISEHVLKQIISHACTSVETVKKCHRIDIALNELPNIKITLTIFYPLDEALPVIAEKIQQKVAEDFLKFLNIELNSITIHISKLSMEHSYPASMIRTARI
ncbi:ATPase [Aeribacillus pallidus]|nr:ATPase [Aeribacillus pallidus]